MSEIEVNEETAKRLFDEEKTRRSEVSVERYASTSDRSPDMDYAEDGDYVFYSDYQDLERQLAEAQHGIQDMETKLRNECQSHAITRKAWQSDKEQFIKAQAENKRLRGALELIRNKGLGADSGEHWFWSDCRRSPERRRQ